MSDTVPGAIPNIATLNPSQVGEGAPSGEIGQNVVPGNVGGASLSPEQAAGLAGTGSGLLFNIPEAVMRAVGGSPWMNKQLANPAVARAYNLGKVGGNVLGTLATVPISPVNVAAKGLEGLGAVKAAETLKNLGTTGNLIGSAARGALEGGAVTGLSEIGQNQPDALKKIGTGALIGAATGGIMGGLGKVLGGGFKGSKILNALRDMNSEEVVGALGGDPGMLKSVAQFGLRKNQTFAKAENIKALRTLAADVASGKGPYATGEILNTPEKMTAWIEKTFNEPYNAMENAYTNAEIKIGDHLDQIDALPAVQKLQQAFPEQTDAFIDKIAAADQEGTYRGSKAILDELINQARLTQGEGEQAARALGAAAQQTKQWVNEAAGDAAVSQGMLAPEDWQKLNELYPVKKLFDGILAKKNAEVARFTHGSDTFARGLVFGSMANLIPGQENETLGQRLATDAAMGIVGSLGGNALAGAAARMGNAGLSRLAIGMRRIMPEAGAAASAIAPDLVEKLADTGTLGARVASLLGTGIATNRLQQGLTFGAQPNETPQAGAPNQAIPGAQGASAAVGEAPNAAFENQMMKAIQYQFLRHTQGNPMLSQISPNNPYWTQFVEGAKEMMTTDGQLDPVKAAPYLFPNQQQARIYQNYELGMSQIKQLMKSAAIGFIGGNLPPFLDPKAVRAKESMVEVVKDMTGSEAAARDAQMILRRKMNPQAVLSQLSDLMVRRSAAPELLQAALQATGGV